MAFSLTANATEEEPPLSLVLSSNCCWTAPGALLELTTFVGKGVGCLMPVSLLHFFSYFCFLRYHLPSTPTSFHLFFSPLIDNNNKQTRTSRRSHHQTTRGKISPISLPRLQFLGNIVNYQMTSTCVSRWCPCIQTARNATPTNEQLSGTHKSRHSLALLLQENQGLRRIAIMIITIIVIIIRLEWRT